jgi:hypothetical protein
MVTCMLLQSGLPKSFWAEAITYAAYINNCIPRKTLDHHTPLQVMYNRKPDYEMLHTFGCEAWRHIPDNLRKSFDPKAEQCIFLGIQDNYSAFRLLRINTNTIMVSKDVEFVENSFPKIKDLTIQRTLSNFTPPTSIEPPTNATVDQTHTVEPVIPMEPVEEEPQEEIHTPLIQDKPIQSSDQIDSQLSPTQTQPQESRTSTDQIFTRSTYDPSGKLTLWEEDVNQTTKRPRTRTPNFHPDHLYNILEEVSKQQQQELSIPAIEPNSYTQAISDRNAARWKDAILEQYNALIRNNTWDLYKMTEIPRHTKLHKPVWKFKIKTDGRFKARLCFNGKHQRKGIDCYETFAPVARIENVRLTITLALRMEMRIHHGDVPDAFLNSPLDADVYMYMPQGFEQPGMVCKLNKGLYGLRQASLLWYKQMHQCLLSLHFKQTGFDNCIYYSEEKVTFISLYVDDILVMSKSQDIIDEIFKALHDKFKIKHMGVVKEYLGTEFHFDEQNRLHLSQGKFSFKLCQTYLSESDTPTKTPMSPRHVILPFNEAADEACSEIKFRAAIGSLLWLARSTRPDIAFIVSLLAQHQLKPSRKHWGAVRHVLKYIRGTLEYGIILNRNNDCSVLLKADASFADTQRGWHSTSGVALFVAGGLVQWLSKKQTTVALHTLEAEMLSIAEGVKVILWCKNCLENLPVLLSHSLNHRPTLETDSNSAVELIRNNDVDAKGIRHVRVKERLFLRHHQAGTFDIKWVPGKLQSVDLLTKGIKEVKRFLTLRDELVIDLRNFYSSKESPQENIEEDIKSNIRL